MSEDWTLAFFNWLEKEKKYSLNTIKSYQTDLRKFQEFLIDQFEQPNMLQVGKVELRTWVMHMLSTGASEATVNRKLVAMSTYFNFGQKQEFINKNPVDLISRPKQPKRLAKFIEESTIEGVFEKSQFTNDFHGCRDQLLFEILYNSGLRVSELIGIKHGDIDASRMELKVLGKGNKERYVPFGSNILSLSDVYTKEKTKMNFKVDSEEPLLVTNKGAKMYPMFVSRKVDEILQGYANVSKTNPHILRHTFATHLLNNGSDINAIKELLGHASLASTSVYTHNSIERLKDVYKKSHPRK